MTANDEISIPDEMLNQLDFVAAFHEHLTEIFPGTLTLNEMRVAHTALMGVVADRPTTNSALSEQLGISKATVSRAVLKLIELDMFTETVHPTDRRRRVLTLADQGRQTVREWVDWFAHNTPD